MNTKKIISILLTVSGIGLVAFVVWKFLKPSSTVSTSKTATTSSATGFDALYQGLGSLFGGNKSQDNTGQLITASGTVATGLFNSVKGFLNSTNTTPVMSPVSPGIPLAPDSVVTSIDLPVDNFDYSIFD